MGWKNKGWNLSSGQPVKNVTDFKMLDEMKSKYPIILKWVS